MDRVQALRFFQAHNHERIQRFIELASARHGLIVQLLPLLFHTNSKVLPGYISDEVPAGLIDYQPDTATLDKAREFENSFKYRSRPLRSYPLRGLYLLSPRGLLQTTDTPTLHLWLLHSDKLQDEQRLLLLQKLKHICHWLNDSGLKLDYKLLSETDLQAKKLSGWESDLLYTSGMVLAGSLPYWWLTTPLEDQQYQESVSILQSQRMLNQASFVDFGEAMPCQPERLFQLACRAVNTSLQQGEGWLELVYLQSLLQRTQPDTLSALLKQQLYQQQNSFLSQDISYLKLLLIEQQGHNEPAREALYQASRELLSKQLKQPRYPWRRDFIKLLVEQWGWTEDKIQQLDRRDYAANRQLYEAIGLSCQTLLRQLQELSRQHNLTNGQQLSDCHKLSQLRLKPAADIIDGLPAALRPLTNSDRLYLQRFENHTDWLLSTQPLQKASATALFRHDNLLHVLAWAINNHLLSRSNWLSVTDQQQRVTTNTVMSLCQQLFQSALADSDLTAEVSKLAEPESLQQVILICNLEQQPNDKLTQQGLQLASKQNDPLNYSSFRQNLLMSVDGLLCSSQGQWHSISFKDENAPLELLVYLLNWQPSGLTETDISAWCPSPIFGQSICHRLISLVTLVCQHYQRFPDSGRVLIDCADRPYSLQWHQQAEYVRRPAAQTIWQSLAENRTQFRANQLDNYLDADGLLNYLLQQYAANTISVFIYLEQNTIICYLLDELGNLTRQQIQHLTESTLVAHLHKFLSDIKTINKLSQLRFYRLSRAQQNWQLEALATPVQTRGYLPISVIMSTPALDAECIVKCGQKSFKGRSDDPALFAQIHKLVLSLRANNQHYPIYLNSLTFTDDSSQPTAVYMQQKARLERLFNAV